MQSFIQLILLVSSLAIGTFIFGQMPLILPLSRKSLRYVELLGAGLLLGSCLTLVIPEGVGAVLRAEIQMQEEQEQLHRTLDTGLGHSVSWGRHHRRHAPSNAADVPIGKRFLDALSGGESIIGFCLLAGFFLMFLLEQCSSKASDPSPPCGRQSTRWQYEALALGDEPAEEAGAGGCANSSSGSATYIHRSGTPKGSVRMHRQYSIYNDASHSGERNGDAELIDPASVTAVPAGRKHVHSFATLRHSEAGGSISSGECGSLEADEEVQGNETGRDATSAAYHDAPSLRDGERHVWKDLESGGYSADHILDHGHGHGQRQLPQSTSQPHVHAHGRTLRAVPSSALLGHSRRIPSLLRPSDSSEGLKAALASIVGLMIHAVADGIAMGASVASADASLTWIVFAALMIHKAPASFGLCSVLLARRLHRTDIRKAVAIFSLCTPFGAVLTYLILSLFFRVTQIVVAGSDPAAAMMEGVQSIAGTTSSAVSGIYIGAALTFSGGTFLYVVMHALEDVTDFPGPDAGEGGASSSSAPPTHRHARREGLRPRRLRQRDAAMPHVDRSGSHGEHEYASTRALALGDDEDGDANNIGDNEGDERDERDWVPKRLRIVVLLLGAVIPKTLQILIGSHSH